MAAEVEHEQYGFVEQWLDVWARYERDPDLGLGIPDHSMGFEAGGFWGYRNTTEEWRQEVEGRAVTIVQLVLDDIPSEESSAADTGTPLGTATITTLSLPFPLRENFMAQVVVPRNINSDEARRLCAFIMTLPADFKPQG